MSETTFEQLHLRLGALAETLGGAHGKTLMFKIANELRRRNRLRVQRQENIDGSPFPPRSEGRGRARAKKKLLLWFLDDKRMRADSGENWAEVGFQGRAAEIAAVHQFGRTIRPFKHRPDKAVRYPIRQIVGMRQADKDYVRGAVAHELQTKLTGA